MDSEWLKDIHLFVAVAKEKSFIKAANLLGIPHSTLSRRITLLEKNLGIRLLNRTTRRVELTEEGSTYVIRMEQVIESAQEIYQALLDRTSKPKGDLRISMPPNFNQSQIVPWIAEFARMYPEVIFQIDTSPLHVDLIAEKVDIAIRIGKLSDSNLTVRKLATMIPLLFAAPSYLQKHGIPNHPKDLITHQCLRLGGSPEETVWHFSQKEDHFSIKIKGQFWFNDPNIGLYLAKQGMGIVSLLASEVRSELAAGQLVQVLSDWQIEPIIISAVMTSRLLPAKTRAFIDFFAAKMKLSSSL